MLRDWLGDWLGTFLGHTGAVWSSRLSQDGSRAVTGGGDFTAFVIFPWGHPSSPPSVPTDQLLSCRQESVGLG